MSGRVLKLPDMTMVRDDTPLQLHVAAVIAFPDGSMSVSGLRRERDRGHLAVERIANREYTTLAAIRHMREACRVQAKAPGSTSGRTEGSGSSGTDKKSAELDALKQIAAGLKKRSPPTSTKSTGPTSASVIPIR